VNGKKIICATGDKAQPDTGFHGFPPTDPKGRSEDVIVYGGKAGGGA